MRYTLAFMVILGVSLITPIGIFDGIQTPAQDTTTETGELLTDPYLLTEPTVTIVGSSGEMDYSYESGELTMTWSHEAGTFLEFLYYGPSGTQPDCEDYIYISKEFTWEEGITPLAFRGSTDITILTNGDFATHDHGESMFTMTVWFAVPDFPWIRVYDIENHPVGEAREVTFITDTIVTHSVAQYAEMLEVHPTFDMIVSLSPSLNFGGYYGGFNNWETFDGSVSLKMNHLSLNALTNTTINQPDPITSNNSSDAWSYSISERGVEINDNGNLVCLGYSQYYSAPPDYQTQVLLDEMNSDHEPIWQTTTEFEETMNILDFSISDSGMYATGYYYDMTTYGCVIKWDKFGNFLWRANFSHYLNDIGWAARTDDQGNVYVLSLAAVSSKSEMDFYHNLIKFDDSGSFLWNRTLAIYDYTYTIYTVDQNQLYPSGFGVADDSIIVASGTQIASYDEMGTEQWRRETNIKVVDVDSDGNIYVFTSNKTDGSFVSLWSSGGTHQWTTSVNFDYGNDWIDSPSLQHLKVAEDGYTYLILEYDRIRPHVSILRIDKLGSIVTDDNIGNYQLDDYLFYRPAYFDMEFTSDSLVHVMGYKEYPSTARYDPLIPVLYYQMNTSLVSYTLTEPPATTPESPFVYDPIGLAMFGASGIIIALVVIDFVRSKRVSIPSNPT
ncbi:MAG: hypothetical protein ACW98Y_19775 [Candidatus Thorarchaeota archaeon]|jgi:hypothetical protein